MHLLTCFSPYLKLPAFLLSDTQALLPLYLQPPAPVKYQTERSSNSRVACQVHTLTNQKTHAKPQVFYETFPVMKAFLWGFFPPPPTFLLSASPSPRTGTSWAAIIYPVSFTELCHAKERPDGFDIAQDMWLPGPLSSPCACAFRRKGRGLSLNTRRREKQQCHDPDP